MADPTIAEQIFESWGVHFAPVPTSRKEEADWSVEIDGCSYLIEEKTKFPNSEDLQDRSKSLTENNQFASVTHVSRNNTLSGIVGKAKRQLKSTSDSKKHQFRLVWFTATGWNAEAKHMQFMATLYGTSKVFEIHGSKTMRECYFFYNPDFFRYRNELDGAIASFIFGETITMYLCLNPYSANYEQLRSSPIIAKLPNGLTDPLAEEKSGRSYVADTNIDRKDSQAILRYLESKYNTGKLANMDFNMASIEFRLPPSNA
jgi:hypothetical protein